MLTISTITALKQLDVGAAEEAAAVVDWTPFLSLQLCISYSCYQVKYTVYIIYIASQGTQLIHESHLVPTSLVPLEELIKLISSFLFCFRYIKFSFGLKLFLAHLIYSNLLYW